MTEEELTKSLDSLMADPRLVELCELQRTGDEVLDVISLSENQHSDILAWMFDAKEGHGQNDEILRDLLISASVQANGETSGLDKRGTTARFFAEWTSSKIRTTSFASAFTARELGMTANERVDLFVIDTQNKFILLIENKAGAAHHEDQLNAYRESFIKAVNANPRLRAYHHVYIALDKKFDGEDSSLRPSSSSWLHLGYDWLKISAKRALMHYERGNSAAKLVVSYCNRQTDWESPSTNICLQIAAGLHQSYPEAVKQLIGFSQGRVEKEWLTMKRGTDSYLLFLLQNKSAVNLLKETKGMASVKSSILSKINRLPTSNVDNKRTRLDMCPANWEKFSHDGCWPVFLRVRYADSSQSKYSLALCWNAKNAQSNTDAENLRNRLIKVEAGFGTHNDSQWRRVNLEDSVSLTALLERIATLNDLLEKTL